MQALHTIRSIGGIIPVRLSATRLPAKAMRDVAGKSALERVASQIRRCARVTKIVVATTIDVADDPLATFAESLGLDVFRGAVDDVLTRLADAATHSGFEAVVEVDGDDLLCAHEYMYRGLEILEREGVDMVTFAGLPIGATPNVLRTSALVRAVAMKDYGDTSTGFFRFLTESGEFKVVRPEITDLRHRHATVRMTLDYPQDLEFFNAVWRELDAFGPDWTLADLVSMLNRRPDIVALNQGLEAIYAEHFTAGLVEMRMKKDHR